MKVITGILLFVTMGIFARAQTPPEPAQAPARAAKVIAELAASSERTVKNSPFSADAISESVQVLADGNRIVRSSTSKLYRNSEGRFRREGSGGTGGFFGSHFEMSPGISIIAPDAGHRYLLNPETKTGRSVLLGTAPEAVVSAGGSGGSVSIVTVPDREAVAKLKEELKAAQASGGVRIERNLENRAEVERLVTIERGVAATAVGGGSFYAGGAEFAARRGNSRTEQLGVQNIEGVEAEGTRTITTIEAGAIGNERPIEIVYERWYSKDLQLVVYSKHSDPRFGEQTYRLTNINRSEPDPSLFTLPQGYRIETEPSGTHRITTTSGQGRSYTVKSPTATTVKANRP